MGSRIAAIVVLLAVGGCRSAGGACDTNTLRIAVQEAERPRSESGESDHDGWPAGVHARAKLLEACPELPKDLRSKLDFSVDTADGQRVAPGIPAESARAFHERLVKICADPTVFDEAPSLPGAQRGPVTMARCGLADEYKFGTPLGEAFLRLGFLAPVLRQYLIDEGVDSQLATQTVEMFGHPITP